MTVVGLIFAALLAYIAWGVYCLEANVRAARKLQIPIVRIPVSVNSDGWLIVQPLIWYLLAKLPIEWEAYPDFVRFSHRNWHFLEKSSPIARFGCVWALVTPAGIHLHVSDPEAITNIFTRWRGFSRPIHKYQMLAVYGHNVFTVDLENWPRHRRAVAKPLHEVTMDFVWHESLTQTREMLRLWTSDSDSGTAQMLDDLRNLSLNVLAAAAYGKPSSFKRFGDEKTKDIATFRDAMSTVQRNAIIVLMTPKWLLSGPLAPKSLARVGRAAQILKGYMMETIAEETKKHLAGEPVAPGILSSLIRAGQQPIGGPGDSQADKAVGATQRNDALSPDEVLGNKFVIDFAGYDTTANALSFVMMLLAAHPDVQEWVAEEISAVCQGTHIADWNYDTFSSLKRCQALFLETLRRYPPITAIPKMTTKGPQALDVGDISITVPAETEIFPLMFAIHTDPAYWDDPYAWKPSRWVAGSETSSGGPTGEELVAPKKGTFFPWSDGPQGCVGKKFAQVEGAAMLACLLQCHRVRVKPRPGETGAQARQRAKDCVSDVNYHLLLKMNNPEDVELECVEVQV